MLDVSRRALVATIACALVLAVAPSTSAATIHDLGTLGGSESWPRRISDTGQVVGWAQVPDGSHHAFSWTHEGGMVDLGTLGGAISDALGVNRWGQVVGYSTTPEGAQHAFSWTAIGGMVDLGTLGGARSIARNVNASGMVVGGSTPAGTNEYRPIRWTAEDGMVDLGTFGGPMYASDVNDAGQIVGGAYPDGPGFSWTADGSLIDLNALDPPRPRIAVAVNEAGQVTGHGAREVGNERFTEASFVWTAEEGMIELGGRETYAAGINDAGQVVGTTTVTRADGEYRQHAFRWTAEGG